jgi:hypothetical protein
MSAFVLRDTAFLAAVAGASPYTALPSDYAGLIRWYDSADYDDDGLADNDPVVNNWTDLTATLDNAVPHATKAPHYKSAGYMANSGHSALYFPDGWHHFDMTSVNLGDFTMISVLKLVSGTTIVMSDHSGNYQMRDTPGALFVPYMYIVANPELKNSAASDNTGWKVKAFRRTSASGVPRFSSNKTHLGEDSGDTNVTTMKAGTIGLYNGGGQQHYFAEVCLYNTVLLDADIDDLFDGYFNIKYLGDINTTP